MGPPLVAVPQMRPRLPPTLHPPGCMGSATHRRSSHATTPAALGGSTRVRTGAARLASASHPDRLPAGDSWLPMPRLAPALPTGEVWPEAGPRPAPSTSSCTVQYSCRPVSSPRSPVPLPSAAASSSLLPNMPATCCTSSSSSVWGRALALMGAPSPRSGKLGSGLTMGVASPEGNLTSSLHRTRRGRAGRHRWALASAQQ